MPVGTGSIKRAAAKKSAADEIEKEQGHIEQTTVEPAERQTATAARGKRSGRKVQPGKDTIGGCCRITEELPVYLL